MELLKILKGLASNEQSNKDQHLLELKKYLKNLPKITSKDLPERRNIFCKVWNCIFYCK